jgi:aquaporin Z
LDVSLVFGLTVVTMAYAIGHISGCHPNSAVSIALWMSCRFEGKGVVLYIIASRKSRFEVGGFAANGFNENSPDDCGMKSVLVTEVVMTFIFLFTIIEVTFLNAPRGFVKLAIGLCFILIHLISIPVTNTFVN